MAHKQKPERRLKKRIAIRIDADLVEYFKREAAQTVKSEHPAGYQTLINEALHRTSKPKQRSSTSPTPAPQLHGHRSAKSASMVASRRSLRKQFAATATLRHRRQDALTNHSSGWRAAFCRCVLFADGSGPVRDSGRIPAFFWRPAHTPIGKTLP